MCFSIFFVAIIHKPHHTILPAAYQELVILAPYWLDKAQWVVRGPREVHLIGQGVLNGRWDVLRVFYDA